MHMHRTLQLSLFCSAAFVVAGCATTAAQPPVVVAAAATAPSPAASGVSPFAAPAPAVARPPAGAASGATAAAAPPAPGQPPAFATVIKDAKEIKGLFALWQKDEKVWIELKPEDFNKPFFFAPKLARGIGENGLFGGSIYVPGARVEDRIVEFRRVNNIVQLVAVNSEFIARDAKSPEARAVNAGFSHSLLSSAVVASSAHPERKTILIDAGSLLLNDMLGLGSALQRAYRQGYSLEGRNTQFTQVRGKGDAVVFNIDAHYYTANIAVPQPGGPPGAPQPSVPSSVPDPRSVVLGLHIAIGKLPDAVMAPRLADARVGHFTTTVQDFGDDLSRTPRQRFVNRWRLEKKDPTAELSEPVKPITFWLDRTIPLKYRDAIAKGVTAWNPAFERIGFKNAVVARVQPDDADFDTLDTDTASIRWMTNAQPLFGAIGPSQVDPRSGEILDADIGFESLSSRNVRALRSQVLVGRAAVDWPMLMQSPDARPLDHVHAPHDGQGWHGLAQCQHAEFAAEQLSYALDVLEARGDVEPGSPDAQQFVLDYLTDTTMHEVGHTLGLRHNFRSSRVYSERQLSDREFTSSNGLAGSVMEYAPINLPRPGERGGTPFQTTLGPYDFWAIEYAYKPTTPGATKEQESAELQRIAARSAEPALAYGTDEDNFLGIDPESLHFDLGDDPVGFAAKRIEIARELIARQETRELKPDANYAVLRRAVSYAVRDAGRAAGILARQIGGIRTLRDHPGSGRDPLVPVPAAVQRRALDVLASGVLSAGSFKISPALQRRLAPDFNERIEALYSGAASVATDYSLVSAVLDMQRALLAQLMSEGVASRLLDSEGKVDVRAVDGSVDTLRLSELYSRLTREVWSELGQSGDISAPRRELQREYMNRLASMLLRPGAVSRADARGLLRLQAQQLLTRINAAGKRGGLSAEARAHLADSADTLTQALQARLQRAGV
jgi:hypothetical protein